MDPELIAYLDERFRGIDQRFQGIDQQIQGLREETSQRFAGMDQRFTGMEQRFTGVEQRFTGVEQRFTGMDKRFDQMDEQLRLTGVRVEALQSQIQIVAEGVAAGNETLEAFKKDVAKEFNNTQDLIKQGYRELDKRVTALEQRRARIS